MTALHVLMDTSEDDLMDHLEQRCRGVGWPRSLPNPLEPASDGGKKFDLVRDGEQSSQKHVAHRHHSLVLHVRQRWGAVQRSNPQQLDTRMPDRRSPRRWCKFRGRSQPSSRPSSGHHRDGNLQQRPRADHAEAERATSTTVRVATVPAHIIGWQASTSEASAGQAGAAVPQVQPVSFSGSAPKPSCQSPAVEWSSRSQLPNLALDQSVPSVWTPCGRTKPHSRQWCSWPPSSTRPWSGFALLFGVFYLLANGAAWAHSFVRLRILLAPRILAVGPPRAKAQVGQPVPT